jgi:hypothetical protein
MRASCEGWLIQAAGGQFRCLGSAVAEAVGVGGVGGVEGGLALGADLGRGAEVDRRGGVQPDPGVAVLVVVVAEEPSQNVRASAREPNALGEDRGVLQRLERGLAVGVVVATRADGSASGPRPGRPSAGRRVWRSSRCPCRRGPRRGCRARPSPPRAWSWRSGVLAGGDGPGHDVAGEDVEHDVEVVVDPALWATELGDVPGPDLPGLVATNSGLVLAGWWPGHGAHRQRRGRAGSGASWTSSTGRCPRPAASPRSGPPTCRRTGHWSTRRAPGPFGVVSAFGGAGRGPAARAGLGALAR